MTTALTLGAITFSNMEIPESINFGGEQSMKVHKLVGGMREINTMGRDDADPTWRGTFRGFTALYRARYLDSIRIAGTPLILTYSQMRYSVVVKSFHADFMRNGFVIPYEIVVVISEDLTQPILFAVPDTIDTAVQDALIQLMAIATLIKNPSFSAAVAGIAGLINEFSPLSNATTAQISSILSEISGAQGIVGEGIAVTEKSLFG